MPTIEVIHPGETVSGWRYLWLKYVSGFKPSEHCARCLVGVYSGRVRRDMALNESVALDEAERYDYLYLCGVAQRGGWAANLHLACEAAPGEVAEVESTTGAVFRISGARRIEIPYLAPGFDHRSLKFTTCRNWRFGVARYGLSSWNASYDRHAQRSVRPAI